MKRLMLAVFAVVALCGIASAEYRETYYIHGFTRSGATILSAGDSITAGGTVTSRWIPVLGAKQVNLYMRAATADSDSVVRVYFQSVDTATAVSSLTAANIDTAITEAGSLGTGVAVYSNYAGTGGVSWGPATGRVITILPYSNTVTDFPYIPQRWMRFVVIAPLGGCCADHDGSNEVSSFTNTMTGVRIWAEVIRDGEPRGQTGYYPFHGTYPAAP